jgi:hypothetical protein
MTDSDVCTGAKGSQYSLRVPFSPENEKKIAVLQKNLSEYESVCQNWLFWDIRWWNGNRIAQKEIIDFNSYSVSLPATITCLLPVCCFQSSSLCCSLLLYVIITACACQPLFWLSFEMLSLRILSYVWLALPYTVMLSYLCCCVNHFLKLFLWFRVSLSITTSFYTI